MVILYI